MEQSALGQKTRKIERVSRRDMKKLLPAGRLLTIPKLIEKTWYRTKKSFTEESLNDELLLPL